MLQQGSLDYVHRLHAKNDLIRYLGCIQYVEIVDVVCEKVVAILVEVPIVA